MEERYTITDINLGQLFERNGEVFRVVGILREPSVDVQSLVTEKWENHAITCRNFAEFHKLDDVGEKRKALCDVIEKLLEKMKGVSSVEQALISGKILGIIKEIKDSEL